MKSWFKVAALAALLLVAPACANKSKAVAVATISHDTLAVAQDLEAQLCWDVPDAAHAPAVKTHCTAAVAAQIGLTDDRHKAINAKIADAWSAYRSTIALVNAGQQADWSTLNTTLDAVIALIKQLQQTPQVAQLSAAVAGAKK